MSIRKREWGDGKAAWVVDYRDPSGKRRLKTFKTKTAAKSWWETTAAPAVHDGTHVADSASVTVGEAVGIWLDAVKVGRDDRGPAEASTLRQYTCHANHYIKPMLGTDTKLSRLSQPRVVAFRDDLLKKTSRATAKKVLASLKGMLSEMEHRGLGRNTANKVRIGDGKRHREHVARPEIAEVKAILMALDGLAGQNDPDKAKAWRRWRALIATAIHTGLRASELRGLPWDAIDLDAGKITVYQRADENGVIGPPKSASSRRTIEIPTELVKMLRAWKVECPTGPLAFPNGSGNPEYLANIYNRAWKPALIAAGVADPKKDDEGKIALKDGEPVTMPRYNFHTLRHFHAAMLIADGANPKEVQAELGHSSIQITYDLYGFLFRDDAAETARRERSERLAGALV